MPISVPVPMVCIGWYKSHACELGLLRRRRDATEEAHLKFTFRNTHMHYYRHLSLTFICVVSHLKKMIQHTLREYAHGMVWHAWWGVHKHVGVEDHSTHVI